MRLDYSPRGAGKTSRAIDWLKGDPNTRYLLTFDIPEAKRLQELHPDLQHRIMSFEQYQEKERGGHVSGAHGVVGLDNADMILQRMLRKPIVFATFTEVLEHQYPFEVYCKDCGRTVAFYDHMPKQGDVILAKHALNLNGQKGKAGDPVDSMGQCECWQTGRTWLCRPRTK